jgi:hypothetical protein
MVSVKGVYEGGKSVILDDSGLNIAEPCEVVVSFLKPACTRERTTDWLSEPWKESGFKPFERESLYART